MSAGRHANVLTAERPIAQEPARARWRPAITTWILAVVVLMGVGAALYPSTAQWLTS